MPPAEITAARNEGNANKRRLKRVAVNKKKKKKEKKKKKRNVDKGILAERDWLIPRDD